eukprot:4236053-Pleurochrysis_carterae.AAC.1
MLVVHCRRQRFGEYIGHIVVGMYLANLDAAVSDVLRPAPSGRVDSRAAIACRSAASWTARRRRS